MFKLLFILTSSVAWGSNLKCTSHPNRLKLFITKNRVSPNSYQLTVIKTYDRKPCHPRWGCDQIEKIVSKETVFHSIKHGPQYSIDLYKSKKSRLKVIDYDGEYIFKYRNRLGKIVNKLIFMECNY